jgi:hypothetical protein
MARDQKTAAASLDPVTDTIDVIVGYDTPDIGPPCERDGVYMIDSSSRPSPPRARPDGAPPLVAEPGARRDPPPAWRGSFVRCGDCGDFLPDETCAKCSREVT